MKKIRRGNDFVFAWEIERNGLPENLSSVLEKHLYLSVLGKRVELIDGVDYDITGNVVRIEVTPTIANILGTYKAEFHYILPDNGLIDEDRKCAVDVDAFIIVNSTAQDDDPSEFTVTSDMAIAFKGEKGDKGDPLTYDDLTPEQKAELQQPATDAIASIQEVELAVETAEGLRVQAELNRRTNTSTAILNAEQATDDANNAAILANEKAGLAATATTEANTARDEANLAATAANTKAGEANTAAMAANTAAQNAQNVADTYASELSLKAAHGYISPETPKTLKDIEQKVDAGQLIYEYTHGGNKKVIVEGIDYATNSFISTNHGLVNGDIVGVVLPQFLATSNPYQNNFPIETPPLITSGRDGYFVVNSSADKFSISQTNAGAQITLTSVTNFDFSKLWFERGNNTLFYIEILNPKICHKYTIYIEGFIMRPPRYIAITGDNIPSNNNTRGLYSYPQRNTNAIQYGFGVAPNDHYLGLCNYGVIEIVNGETGMMQKQYYNKTTINGTTHIPINFMINSFEKIGNVTKFLIGEMFISNGTKIRLYGE